MTVDQQQLVMDSCHLVDLQEGSWEENSSADGCWMLFCSQTGNKSQNQALVLEDSLLKVKLRSSQGTSFALEISGRNLF